MGLDMYLYKRSPLYKDESEAELFKAYDAMNAISYSAWKEIREKAPNAFPLVAIMYWRKANMVHRFLMECEGEWVCNDKGRIGDNDGNCGYKRIPIKEIDRLIDICGRIVKDGFVYGIDNKHYEATTDELDGKEPKEVRFDATVAERELQTQEGFFYGSYAYDGYYLYDVADTYEKLSELKEQGKLEGDVYYHPWW